MADDGQNQLSRRERRQQARDAAKRGEASGNQTSRRLVVWGGLVVGLGLIVWGLVAAVTQERAPLAAATLAAPAAASDQWLGSATAPVNLVEYSDYQCPACASYAPMVERLASEFSADLGIVYRHFPLRNLHANAELAARAAEAAGRQDKFWEYSAMLFDRQKDWAEAANPRDLLRGYASELSLDADQFDRDLDDQALADKIEADYQSGLASGVRGTPTFFLNGTVVENPRRYEDFASLIEQAINARRP